MFLLSLPHLSDRKPPAYQGFKECGDGVVKQLYTECRTHLWNNSTHVPHFPQHVDFWHGVLFVDYQWVMIFALFLARSLHYI